MKTRSVSRSFLLPFLVTATAASAPAQVPDGWAVASQFRDANVATAPGGLAMFHPSRPGQPIAIAGLGPDLTGAGAPTQINGASSVLVRSSDGALVVGEHVTGRVDAVDIHLLILRGNQVVQDRRFNIGRVVNAQGFGWIDQMAWLPDGQVVFTQRGSGYTSPLGIATAGILDLNTGAIQALNPIVGTSPNALAVAPDGTTVYLGILGGGPSRIAAIDLLSGTVRFSPTLQGTVLQLAVDHDGTLLAGFTQSGHDLARIDPASFAVTPIPGLTDVNALALEPISGDYLAYGLAGGAGVMARIDRTGTVHRLLPVDANDPVPSGIAVVPSMTLYGSASPVLQNLYAFELAPNPGGAPALGNGGFGLTVASTPGTAPGAIAVAGGPASLPVTAALTVQVDLQQLLGLFFLPPQPTATLPIPVPNDPAFLGLRLFAQNFHLEAGQILGSQGLRFTVF